MPSGKPLEPLIRLTLHSLVPRETLLPLIVFPQHLCRKEVEALLRVSSDFGEFLLNSLKGGFDALLDRARVFSSFLMGKFEDLGADGLDGGVEARLKRGGEGFEVDAG